MSVNVDGHSDSANIINSISMALSGTTLTTTVNGRSASTSIASALSSRTYITSGFSAYSGHSAIGASIDDEDFSIGMGVIQAYGGNWYINGIGVFLDSSADNIISIFPNNNGVPLTGSRVSYSRAIVF